MLDMHPVRAYLRLVRCGGAVANSRFPYEGLLSGEPERAAARKASRKGFFFSAVRARADTAHGPQVGPHPGNRYTVWGCCQVARCKSEPIRGARLTQHARGSHRDIAGPLRRCDPLPILTSQWGRGSRVVIFPRRGNTRETANGPLQKPEHCSYPFGVGTHPIAQAFGKR